MRVLDPTVRQGGRLAIVRRPFLLWMLLAAFGSALPLAGCFGGGLPLPSARPGEPLAPDADRIESMAEQWAEAQNDAERASLAAVELRASGVAPIADVKVPGGESSFTVGVARRTLAGWVPGRIPLHRDSLVVVTAPRDGTSDLALIEAMRMLVASGAYTQSPARSVLVVIGDDVRAPLRLWRRDAVLSGVRVGSSAPDSLYGRSFQTLAPEADAVRLAARLYDAISTAATPEASVYTR